MRTASKRFALMPVTPPHHNRQKVNTTLQDERDVQPGTYITSVYLSPVLTTKFSQKGNSMLRPFRNIHCKHYGSGFLGLFNNAHSSSVYVAQTIQHNDTTSHGNM